MTNHNRKSRTEHTVCYCDRESRVRPRGFRMFVQCRGCTTNGADIYEQTVCVLKIVAKYFLKIIAATKEVFYFLQLHKRSWKRILKNGVSQSRRRDRSQLMKMCKYAVTVKVLYRVNPVIFPDYPISNRGSE